MIEWNPDKLNKDFGEELAKKFHLVYENILNAKNVIRINKQVIDIDYFGINVEIRFKEDENRLLLINVFPHQRNLEGLLDFIKRHIETGLIFSETGSLKFVGSRKEFKKYRERLNYMGSREEEIEDAAGRKHRAVSLSYKVKDSLLKLKHDSFNETTISYALLPIFSWIYGSKTKQ